MLLDEYGRLGGMKRNGEHRISVCRSARVLFWTKHENVVLGLAPVLPHQSSPYRYTRTTYVGRSGRAMSRLTSTITNKVLGNKSDLILFNLGALHKWRTERTGGRQTSRLHSASANQTPEVRTYGATCERIVVFNKRDLVSEWGIEVGYLRQ